MASCTPNRCPRLLVDDGLTGAMTYTEEIIRPMEQPGNPELTFVGTCAPCQDRPGIRNEGYGAWRAAKQNGKVSRIGPSQPPA